MRCLVRYNASLDERTDRTGSLPSGGANPTPSSHYTETFQMIGTIREVNARFAITVIRGKCIFRLRSRDGRCSRDRIRPRGTSVRTSTRLAVFTSSLTRLSFPPPPPPRRPPIKATFVGRDSLSIMHAFRSSRVLDHGKREERERENTKRSFAV